MKLEHYLTAWKNLNLILRFYKVCFLIAMVCLLVVVFYSYELAKKQRVVIIPTHLASKVEISDLDASPSYIRVMGSYFADLLFDFTPYNIEKRYSELLSFADASLYSELKKVLDEKIVKVGKVNVSQDFQADKIYILSDNGCLVSGSVKRYAGSEFLGSDNVRLIIKMKFINGGVYVKEIREISDSEYNSLIRISK